MNLPTINAINPTAAPAQPAMSFNQAFLTLLHFNAQDSKAKWTLAMNTRNYDAASGTLAPNTPPNNHGLSVSDVAAEAAQYPVFASCLATVLITAGLMATKAAAEDQVAAANRITDPTAKATALAAANAALTAAKTALGYTPPTTP